MPYVDMIYNRKSFTSMPFWQWSNYWFSETLYQCTKLNRQTSQTQFTTQ